jgi:polyhydroxybutyrate depolymerase
MPTTMAGTGWRRAVVAGAALTALVSVVAASVDGSGPANNGKGDTIADGTSSGHGAVVSHGCGRTPVPGPGAVAATTASGDVVQSLPVGGLIRSYRLAVPTRYHPSSPTPLILLFHGSGSDALETSIYTQLPSRASHAGFLVASPDAEAKQWQISLPGARTDDLAFVAALIAELSARYCVDRSRVYAAGISLGSEFSAIAACTSGNRIAAIGLVAAEFLLRPCTGPIPVIAFHGTDDPLVPYRSGRTGASFPGVPVIGVEQNLANWADLDGCRPVPAQVRPASMILRQTWAGCTHGTAVVLYTVEGGGHTWPGSPITLPVATFGPTTHQIDATALMIRFFDRMRHTG